MDTGASCDRISLNGEQIEGPAGLFTRWPFIVIWLILKSRSVILLLSPG
jgi:hypothetical protein